MILRGSWMLHFLNFTVGLQAAQTSKIAMRTDHATKANETLKTKVNYE